jgi:uncharacterized protein (TIGR00297 family)
VVSLPLALLLGVVVAGLAWRARSLTPAGGVAAAAVGAAILTGAGWWGGVALLTFFVGSSGVSRLCPDPAVERGEAKGGARDAGQVLANGGAPALGALLALLTPGASLWVVTIGLAAAAADTWATSFGGLSRTPPRSILSGAPVPAGTSGGVTLRGTLGGVVGAATLAAIGWLATRDPRAALGALLIGTAGMLFDSFLGALAQGRFRCDHCSVTTERAVHRCGTRTVQIGGIRWLTNDGVNAFATCAATAAGWWWWHCWR